MIIYLPVLQIFVVTGSQYPVGFVSKYLLNNPEEDSEAISFQAFNRVEVFPMGVLGGSQEEHHPVGSFSDIVGFNLFS